MATRHLARLRQQMNEMKVADHEEDTSSAETDEEESDGNAAPFNPFALLEVACIVQ